MESGAPRLDRELLWLSLMREVTARFPSWAVWKNAESALHGHGDIDSFAHPRDWPSIETVFLDWVREHGLGPPIICRHVPQGPHFVTLDPHSDYLLQFDVKVRATFRGCTLMDVADLQTLSKMDDRGFRGIRPGAEGVIKLLYNGMDPGGVPNPGGLQDKRIPDLLSQDPVGADMACELVGSAAPRLRRAVAALLDGGWDQSSLVAVERWAKRKALTEPGVALSRIWFNAVPLRRCPVLEVIRRHDRRVPEDRTEWLRRVARGHRMPVIGRPSSLPPEPNAN